MAISRMAIRGLLLERRVTVERCWHRPDGGTTCLLPGLKRSLGERRAVETRSCGTYTPFQRAAPPDHLPKSTSENVTTDASSTTCAYGGDGGTRGMPYGHVW